MLLLFAMLLVPAASAADVDVTKTLKGIEDRYNHIQTLQVNFAETYTLRGRKLPAEKGTLFLRKPGRMRWQYTAPAGKLFVSDGDFIYSYFPDQNRAEKNKFKETEDLRAPLAFLLGKLDFQKDFREFIAKPQGADAFITAIPRSDKLPYTEVSFLVAPDSTIKQLTVKGQDGSVYDFSFDSEKKNPQVADAMFRFTPPPGAEFVDSSKAGQ